ncbi:hypothetical protein Ahy_A09g046154 isoform C [Arachis hypogaea]|uniref:Uncharacterized protein n=1 Tax=Arachis hypogaea TaxID=3818 RepID=A0A445BP03_ARAHY|nr:hypothetical protein Ahy_A09g046154 isoform C [Arachis hypogaea]
MPYPSQGCGLEIEPASHKRTSYWFPLLLESSSMIFRFLNALVGFGLFDRGFLVRLDQEIEIPSPKELGSNNKFRNTKK